MPPRLLALSLLLLACEPVSDDPPATDDTAAPGGSGGGSGSGTGGEDTASPDDTGSAPSTTSGTRGIWAWRDAGDPYGTDAVVGDPAAEEAMVADLIAWDVAVVYGSYGDRPSTEPEVIAAWNARLHEAGIDSHVLMGDPAWISSREWAAMEEKFMDRLVDFNDSRADPLERFDGLHLDIEPQAAADWSGLSESDKQVRLMLLAETYEFARTSMDATSGASLPMGADLAVWFDNLPPGLGGTGSVGWTSSTERDTWFTDLDGWLASASMMAYERETEALIVGSVATEAGLYGGELRVGLNEEVGTTWATIDDMFDMADDLEVSGHFVDLHSYSKIRALVP